MAKERKSIKKLKNQIKRLKNLVTHCWVYSGWMDCGYRKMGPHMRELYRKIIGRTDADQAVLDNIERTRGMNGPVRPLSTE